MAGNQMGDDNGWCIYVGLEKTSTAYFKILVLNITGETKKKILSLTAHNPAKI
jgi:hypothetical protein